MSWSIESLDGGQYGIVRTEGHKSRTVYLAMSYGDAAELLVMAEVYELMKGGVPVEVLKTPPTAKPAPKAKRRTAKK